MTRSSSLIFFPSVSTSEAWRKFRYAQMSYRYALARGESDEIAAADEGLSHATRTLSHLEDKDGEGTNLRAL